jgi:hypothetical protein
MPDAALCLYADVVALTQTLYLISTAQVCCNCRMAFRDRARQALRKAYRTSRSSDSVGNMYATAMHMQISCKLYRYPVLRLYKLANRKHIPANYDLTFRIAA